MTKVGAVVYDENFGSMDDQKHLAVYWRAEEPSNDLKTFYGLDHAKNHQEYLNALQYYSCPGQNFVYADRDNNVAIRQQGYFMMRTQAGEGSFVMPLATADLNRLKQKIPVEQNPYVLNPERGFVSSANQKPVDHTYPYLTNGVYENLRNRVINHVLANSSNIKARDMMNLQGNNFSLLAKESLPIMLSFLDETKYTDELSLKMIQALKNWNYYTDPNRDAPTFFYKWYDQVANSTWDEFESKDVSLVRPQNYVLSILLANDPKFKLFDIVTSDTIETAKEVVDLAFKNTVAFFKNYLKEHNNTKWVTYKNTTIKHLAQLDAFSISGISIGGWNNVVNATSDFFGPSWRMVVDFSTGKPTAYGIYPGGQNGNPASKNYSNMIPAWAANNYYTLGFYDSKEEAMKGIKK
jgi:penicillin amidase